jgi:hypothetical protein
MSLNDRRWCVVGSIPLVPLAFLASNAWLAESMLLLAVMGLVPAIIMLALWKEPSRTIAVGIPTIEDRR